MVEIGIEKKVKVQAKVLKIYMKVCDEFQARLVDQDGEQIFEWDNEYVPGFMPGEHYGDYLILDIDIDTGQILNWKKLTPGDIEECIKKDEE